MQFNKIIGHAALKARLIGNIRDGRIPHAQFFLGPRGSGVLPLALAYAAYLLCEDRGEGDSCGSCKSCSMAGKLAHPDLHAAFPIFFVDKKPRTSDYYIGDWRAAVQQEPYLDADAWRDHLKGDKQLLMGDDIAAEVLRKLSLRSFFGGWKVMLVWLPELMNPTMANKILKILEEPEPKTVFLLAGHSIDRILPTILSRAQLIKVAALDPGEVAPAVLERYPELSEEQARGIAARSEGDLLEAYTMAEGREQEAFTFLRDWLRACYGRKWEEAVAAADHFAKMGREHQKGLMAHALFLMRQCMLHLQDLPQLITTSGEEWAFVQKFSTVLSMASLEAARTELEAAHGHLERNANPKVLFLDLSYSLGALLRGRETTAP
ncbi:MAG: hypothetical protein KBH07_00655 [Flavobacteriales bacterium]|nr:hypothetical protein [Flavobacteriales bacterium]MBP9078771.1 hypothetical protein [Flavobacteriales bacterium]